MDDQPDADFSPAESPAGAPLPPAVSAAAAAVARQVEQEAARLAELDLDGLPPAFSFDPRWV